MLPTLTPIDTIGYTYNSTDWTDQLVQYGNETISYDTMGNPLTYRGYTFGWRGKQLTTASNGTDTLSFEYNEDGLRQQKTVNNVDTNYFYNGSVLIGMQRGTSKFLFSYVASGNVVSVNYNGTEYYYLRNAQGDIVKLIDANGTPVVEYTYDTWGKKVTTTGTLAGTLGLFQPFRYRGYVYDEETGFYYLQSRYYDPTVGRFISADVLLSTGQGVLGHNCYAYCLDNPVNLQDSGGYAANWAVSVMMADGGGASYSEILKNRIRDLYSDPKYSRDNWEKQDRPGRARIMREFFADVSDILGISDYTLVLVTSTLNGEKFHPNGFTSPSESTIYINYRGGMAPYERLKTIVHELRHAYQYLVYNDLIDHREADKTVKIWRDNWNNYISYKSELDNFDEYYGQPIEVDARWFADQ